MKHKGETQKQQEERNKSLKKYRGMNKIELQELLENNELDDDTISGILEKFSDEKKQDNNIIGDQEENLKNRVRVATGNDKARAAAKLISFKIDNNLY
jgi:hypothetical protein